MLQHAVQCCGTSRHAAAYRTMPWHKKQHHGTKHNALAHTKKQRSRHIANALAQKKRHGMTTAQKPARGAMPQQIVEGRGRKHNAMALVTLPQHKAYCRSTISCRGTQKSPRHKKRSGTKRNAAAHKTCCSTKIMPQNAAEECTMPLQETTKSKMPPNTMTTTPPRPPKPNRLIIFFLTTARHTMTRNVTKRSSALFLAAERRTTARHAAARGFLP